MLDFLLPPGSVGSINSSPFTTVSLSSTGDNNGGVHTLQRTSTVTSSSVVYIGYCKSLLCILDTLESGGQSYGMIR